MLASSHPLISVRMRREYLGINSEDMARRLGIKRTSYLRYERGERRVYLDHSLAIAKMLGCKVDDLTRMPTPDEVRDLYAEGQRRRRSSSGSPLVSDTTGELITAPPEPIEAGDLSLAPHDDLSHFDKLINKTDDNDPGIVVDAHVGAQRHDHDAQPNNDLAAALAGWDDSE